MHAPLSKGSAAGGLLRRDRIFELRIATVTRKQKYNVFRALHERHGAFVIPNPWNAGTARILTALGFEALATTSAGYAFAVGRLDSAAGLTRDAILENAKAIVEATHLPVSADLEDGFGRSPKKCASTIRTRVRDRVGRGIHRGCNRRSERSHLWVPTCGGASRRGGESGSRVSVHADGTSRELSSWTP